jgi:hypothetical protein
MGHRISDRAAYWFERVSEIIAAALCVTLIVSLVMKAEHRLSFPQQLDTIEDQYAMSWSIDHPLFDAPGERAVPSTSSARAFPAW